jgi:hypothetical protein
MASLKLKQRVPMVGVSIVLFDVQFTASRANATRERALRWIFAECDGVKFRDSSSAFYVSGNYKKLGEHVFVGRFERTRNMAATQRSKAADGSNLLTSGGRADVSDSWSVFAFNARSGVLAFRERTQLPFKRLQSYLRVAARSLPPKYYGDARIELVPRTSKRSIKEWFKHFDAIRSVSATFTHAKSPGNKLVNKIVKTYGAEQITESIRAEHDKSLSIPGLLDTETPFGQVVEHIDVNRNNGEIHINGRVGPEDIRVNTREPVERHRRQAENNEEALKLLLAGMVAGYDPPEGSEPEEQIPNDREAARGVELGSFGEAPCT